MTGREDRMGGVGWDVEGCDLDRSKIVPSCIDLIVNGTKILLVDV